MEIKLIVALLFTLVCGQPDLCEVDPRVRSWVGCSVNLNIDPEWEQTELPEYLRVHGYSTMPSTVRAQADCDAALGGDLAQVREEHPGAYITPTYFPGCPGRNVK